MIEKRILIMNESELKIALSILDSLGVEYEITYEGTSRFIIYRWSVVT